MSLAAEQIALLERDSWFGAIAPERRDALLASATIVARKNGARIYATGDPPNGLWGVVEGRVRLLDYPVVGAEVLIRSLCPGAWFGELSTIDAGPRPQDAVAFGSVTLLHIPHAVWVGLARSLPDLHHDLALLACAHQRAALAFIGQRVAQPVPARLAGALLSATHDGGQGPLAIRQDELALIVGVSRQTLNRTLKSFERDGVLRTRYGAIEILDPDRLRRLQEGVSVAP
ncbi:Crp/Fnr family transcriptional regulator [Brevundimonas sp.]|jgi:CRP/FNR family transcriptional regulator, cyclic AMP receptor protein|uniref:Crp/Fnr family transcriptional regulator n=1 Tax=Brevundimonas sp. TaxID=1871086 RepID=UPI00180D4F59|nr:Crp/Fnr family transcriptional regulator [Brevundimonas sp.]MBA4806689.1 Crp/Fnr family transcriptional regulator [Brevundimonas sp.]